jgi:putative component of toxin-antitoxin plasmid stabilization module
VQAVQNKIDAYPGYKLYYNKEKHLDLFLSCIGGIINFIYKIQEVQLHCLGFVPEAFYML